MKLHLSILQRLIDLPTTKTHELRRLLDDLGLEVKDIDESSQTPIFNIETLANRGDHLYALGVARELSARLLTSIRMPALASLPERRASLPIKEISEKCLRYSLLELNVPATMPLRPDIRAVLGDTGRHPIVDVLAYVQLELGQPMHAFDRDKVDGEVGVVLSSAPEKILALDGKEYTVPSGSLLIRDRRKTIAVAGVIGCENTMATHSTTRVLVESAAFDPVTVRLTAGGMGISTDASYAFERGTDQEGPAIGLRRVTQLCEAGEKSAHVVGHSTIDGKLRPKKSVRLSVARLRKQINAPRLDEVEVTSRLKNLGYGLTAGTEKLNYSVSVPSWRLWDVENEEDLFEDFVRSHGLNRIRHTLPPLDYEISPESEIERISRHARETLHGQGFFEVITRSFYSLEEVSLLKHLEPAYGNTHISLKGSVEKAISHVRASTIPQYCELAAQAQRKGVASFKIYEIARLFSVHKPGDSSWDFERRVVTLGASGRWYEGEFRKSEPLEDRVRLFKGVVEGFLRSFGCHPTTHSSQNKLLHPGIQATLKFGRKSVAYLGAVHPQVTEAYDLKGELLYAEIDVEILRSVERELEFSPPSEFPSIRRDFTFKVQADAPAGQITRWISELKPTGLIDVAIVDDFKKADESFRRSTYRLTFQTKDRTLEHGEVDSAVNQLLTSLREKHSLDLAN